MWFRNLTLYALPGFTMKADAIAAQLAKNAFTPCESYSAETYGWGEAFEGQFVYTVDGEHLISLTMEKKVLPPAVVKQEVARRVAEWTKNSGYKPNKRVKKEIKEDAYDALLPKAFGIQKSIRAWVSPKRGLFAIDTVSQRIADRVAISFLRALEVPVNMRELRFVTEPVAAMTEWISNAPPDGFTADDDTTFASNNVSKAVVKFSNVTLADDEARRQIEGGKHVTRLAMTWDDKVSFVLSGDGSLRRVSALDVLMAPKKENAETFNADFLLMTHTYGELIAALAESLDGIAETADLFDAPADEEASDPDADEAHTEPPPAHVEYDGEDADPLLDQAKAIVVKQNKASISVVQRHLRIGYNRAARLLESLETLGVVSAMKSNGTRTVKGA